jgi:hypothetical protein
MQIELTPEQSFTVKANGKSIPGMRLVSEWEGLKKLQDARGRSLIIADHEEPFTSMFRGILGDVPRSCYVVMGSPELIGELVAKEDQA